MKLLKINKYFLSIKEREILEKRIIEKHPERFEEVLLWDDKQLKEAVHEI